MKAEKPIKTRDVERIRTLFEEIKRLKELNERLEIAAKHSPESYDEWERIVKYHPSPRCQCKTCKYISNIQQGGF